MVIEEKDLSGLGGWDCYKKASTYLVAGSVLKSSSSALNDNSGGILFTGLVLEGRKKYVCGLKFRSLEDVDNLCRCKRSISDGSVCEHSLAVVLHSIKEAEKSKRKNSQVIEEEYDKDRLYGDKTLPVFTFGSGHITEIEAFSLNFESACPEQCLSDDQISRLRGIFGNVNPTHDKTLKCNKSQFGRALEVLKGSCVYLKSESDDTKKLLIISETEARIPLNVIVSKDDDFQIKLLRSPLECHFFLGFESKLWILNEKMRIVMPTADFAESTSDDCHLKELLAVASEEASVLVKMDWLRCNSAEMNKLFHMECSDELIKSLRLLPANPNLKLSVEGSLRSIKVTAEFIYQRNDIVNDMHERSQLIRLGARDAQRTKDAESFDDSASQKANAYSWTISGEDNVFSFYAGELDEVIRLGDANVVLGERFYRVTKDIEKVRPAVRVKGTGGESFDFELEFIGNEGTIIPENEMRRILMTGKSSVKVSGRSPLVFKNQSISELFAGFEISSMDQSLSGGNVTRSAGSAEIFYVEALLNDLADFEIETDSNVLSQPRYGFSAKLKQYQMTGLSWMNRRLSKGCGLILADEMGLGKTVQALAVICSAQWLKGPVLIICPTSLIDNWNREIKKFTHDCNVLIIHGAERSDKIRYIQNFDIIISSYGTIVNDSESYREMHFSLIVADESSYLKNPDTKTFKALAGLNAGAKMAMSGTPLENKLLDLWSVMELVNPSYLGSRKEFLTRYSGEVSESDHVSLRRRVSPFVLRRTKKMVLKDLPAKTERIIHCALTNEQRRTYEGILRTGKKQLMSLNPNNNDISSRFEILSILLRLRQACCDSKLIEPGTEHSRQETSGKIEPMMSVVRSSISSGGKVLIFSQFVRMLRILDNVLSENEIDFCSLDGSTPRRKRDSQIKSFQNDTSGPSVFLISLKAGGYGLNLTAADTVIHFDPWWNPSVENQATDRAHRIGQNKSVTSYKLIAAGTVEERILKLQEKKKGLIDVVDSDAEPMMSGLSDDDIRAILS